MWFRMPEGYETISVEQQTFVPEVTDEKGVAYFRAPDHFATRILMVKGFAVAVPPEGSPEDLPKADPLRDGAIAQLTAHNEAQKTEIQNLRSDLQAAVARVTALTNENNAMKVKITAQEKEIEDLKDELEDRPLPLPAKAK